MTWRAPAIEPADRSAPAVNWHLMFLSFVNVQRDIVGHPGDERTHFSNNEVAALLGVSEASVRRLIASSERSCVRFLGRHVRVHSGAVGVRLVAPGARSSRALPARQPRTNPAVAP